VAGLVADGLTNPQIGARLYISGRTVQTHLVHVFAKLDIASRVQLAVQVALHQYEPGRAAPAAGGALTSEPRAGKSALQCPPCRPPKAASYGPTGCACADAGIRRTTGRR
jgi:hypothetical protein